MRTALVLGGAECVFRDIEAATALFEPAGVVGVNILGIHWPGRFEAWVSLHGDRLPLWAERRRRRALPPHHRLIGPEDAPHRFPGQENTGSSSLFAVKVALDVLGFDRVVVCGAPLVPEAAHFDDPAPWKAARLYREGWREALPHIADRVRSCSGWTAELLGTPTPDWIGGQ